MLNDIFRALFLSIPPTAPEAEYNAPWNALLSKCFPFDEGFIVVPVGHVADGRDRVDYPIQAFEVKRIRDKEVCDIFILEIRGPSDLNVMSKRKGADLQIRRRFTNIRNIPPTLHAASAFGTILRLYKNDRETGIITPPFVKPRRDGIEEDTCPKDEWNVDILEEAGFEAFMQRVNEAKRLGRAELALSYP